MTDFNPIQLPEDEETVSAFRHDSFQVSFGAAADFEKNDYLDWLFKKKADFPDGFVSLKEDKQPIGQLELSIREFAGQEIGYVHLYYLIPEKRGQGFGKILHDYAHHFFKNKGVSEYHLRVAPTNERALKFYRKNDMEKMREEMDGKVIRMKGYV